MKYMLLIYGDERSYEKMTEKDAEANMGEWFAYTEDLRKAGVMVAGDPLRATSTASTVRVRQGKTLTTDGPFAETKEQLGGYYLLDVRNLDEALKWAARCPGARTGSIEVRPLMEIPPR